MAAMREQNADVCNPQMLVNKPLLNWEFRLIDPCGLLSILFEDAATFTIDYRKLLRYDSVCTFFFKKQIMFFLLFSSVMRCIMCGYPDKNRFAAHVHQVH
jgi:hypothetical protein